eukprot:gene11805-5139_t
MYLSKTDYVTYDPKQDKYYLKNSDPNHPNKSIYELCDDILYE